MIQTLWAICAWTGLVWWCCLFIVLPWIAIALWRRDENCDLPEFLTADDELPANWQERDSLGSTEEAWAEMRRRKSLCDGRDRPACTPGRVECMDCGCIFIGEDDHQLCGVCVKA